MFEEEDDFFCIFCESDGCEECKNRTPYCDWCESTGCDQCSGVVEECKYEQSRSGWSQVIQESSTIGTKPELIRTPSFGVLGMQQIIQDQERLVDQVQGWLDTSTSDADLLLRYYRYNLSNLESHWFEDPAACRQEAGLCGNVFPPNEKIPSEVQCEAYCSVVSTKEAHRLACGHWLCDDCWTGYLESEINAGTVAVLARCPAMQDNKKCRELITMDTCNKYLSKESLAKLNRWITTSFVECTNGLTWCPSPNCEHAVRYNGGGIKVIGCDCGFEFCFTCLQEPHEPCPCDLAKRWNAETGANAQEIATQKLIAATAKQCPNCHTWITKDRHCNHMKCTKCSHHFCWLCLASFTRETGHNDYYKCSVYDDSQARGEVSEEEKQMLESNVHLQKLMLHQNMFDDCKMDMQRMQSKYKVLQGLVNDNPLLGAQWLEEAMTSAIESYRSLQWTHVMMYFMKSSTSKDLFGKQQETLMLLVDELDTMLEEHEEYARKQQRLSKTTQVNPLIKLLENEQLKLGVKQLVKTSKKMYDTLMDISMSSFEDILQYKPDTHSTKWACVACTAANDDHFEAGSRGRVTKCSQCGACRAHGEPDCRVPKCGIHPRH